MTQVTQGQAPEHNERTVRILTDAGKVPEEWLSSEQLAWYLKIDHSRIRGMIRDGKIPDHIRLGYRVFFPKDETLLNVHSRKTRKAVVESLKRSLGSDESVLPEQLRSDSTAAAELMSVESTAPIPKVLLPKARTQASYLRATAATVSLEDWADVVKTALSDAKEGDAKARTWLSSYLIGTPIQRIAAIVTDTADKFPEDERLKLLHTMLFGEENNGDSGAEEIVDATYTDSSEVSG